MAGLGDVGELLSAFRLRDAAALEELAAHGIDLESRDAAGCTVLMRAAESGEPGPVQWILEAGSRLEARATWKATGGRDALMIAAAQGHGAVVDLLLAAGASAEAEDDNGQRAIDLAIAAGHTEVSARLKDVSGRPLRAPMAAETSPEEPSSTLADDDLIARVPERGLGRFDGEEICLLMRAAPTEVAAWWQVQCPAEHWQQDAYGENIEVRGLCFLVFRFRGHAWTILRAVHEGRDSRLSIDQAARWAKDLGGEGLFLDHSSRNRRLVYRYYRAGDCLRSESWPSRRVISDPWDDRFEDPRGDRFDDSFEDSAILTEVETGLGGWHRTQLQVDDHLRQLGAYVPSWGRLRDRVQRLEVAGLAPAAFERMDFLARRDPT